MTGGQYFLARDKDRLQEIYTELDKLEPIEYEETENKPVTLLYPYPLAGATGPPACDCFGAGNDQCHWHCKRKGGTMFSDLFPIDGSAFHFLRTQFLWLLIPADAGAAFGTVVHQAGSTLEKYHCPPPEEICDQKRK
jgi:hypothetical protein